MIKLYVKTNCGFCRIVEEVLHKMGIDYDRRDIYEKEEYKTELLEKGGKTQTPFMIDEEKGIEMYESIDIIEHLKKNYSEDKEVNINTEAPKVCVPDY